MEVVEAPVLQLLAEVLDTNPLRQMQLVSPVEAQDGVKVPGRSVKVVFSLGQRVSVTELLQACSKQQPVSFLVVQVNLHIRL